MNAQTTSTQSSVVVPGAAEVGSGNSRNYAGLLASLGFAALACGASPASAQNVSLGTAANFGVLAGSAVTNTGPTVVTGNVGVFPGSAISGFPPGSIVPGTGFQHNADSVAQQAQSDLTNAYNDAATRVCGTTIAGGLLGGLTLTPGVYCMGAGSLTGILTLNGAGVYIFQMASSLTTAPGSSVVLQNGAAACGVWWQVTSSAVIDTTSAIEGNILALTSITLNTGATVNGRVLARNALVSLASNTITPCSGGPVPPVPPPIPMPPSAGGVGAGVPTLHEMVMIMLAGLLAIAGLVAIRRRVR
jgi:hypothetical protein